MEHPYLYFSKQDISYLRERFTKEPFLTRWNLMLKDANEILTRPPVGLHDDRLSYRYAATTAFVYAITGEKSYADRAILEVLNNFTLDVKERWQFNSVECCGAGLGTSNFSLSTGLVYDWCYDALTDEQRQTFRDGFSEIVNPLYLESLHHTDNREKSDWWVFNYHSNWSAVCHAAQGIAALAFYDEFDSARIAVRSAERHNAAFFKHNVQIDGGCAEGLMYARYGIEYALYFLVAACRFFGLDRPRRDIIKSLNDRLLGYWDMYLLSPDLGYANFGNMDEEVMRAYWDPVTRNGVEPDLKEGPNAIICAFLDAVLPEGDPLLRWGADVGGAWYIWNGACPFHLLWRRDDAPPLTAYPVTLQDAVFFRETGQAIFNSGSFWLAFNGGLVSPDSHFNRDLGTFILLYNNERFIHDPGYSDSDTASHSTLIVNGYGQLKGGYGTFLTVDKGERFYALACDMTNAYDPLSRLTCFVRHMLIIDDRYVMIVDEVRTQDKAAIEILLQTRKILAIHNATTASIQGTDGKLHVAYACDQGRITLSTRRWNRKERRKHTVFNTLCARSAEAASAFSLVTVLYPAKDDTPAPSIAFSGDTIRVTCTDGRVDAVIFTRHDGCLRLESVNGEKLTGRMNPHERSVIPFRDATKHEVDETVTPPWLFNRE